MGEEVIGPLMISKHKQRLEGKDLALGLDSLDDEDRSLGASLAPEIFAQDTSFENFLLGLVHRVKNHLVSIKTLTHLLQEKGKINDVEFRESFVRVVSQDVEEIDHIFNHVLNYLRISHPVIQPQNVNPILEVVIAEHMERLAQRRILVTKRFAENLPEAMIDGGHLKYALDHIISTASSTLSEGEKIDFTTRVIPAQENSSRCETLKNVEIRIAHDGCTNVEMDVSNLLSGDFSYEGSQTIDLELNLAKKIIEKDGGRMMIEVSSSEDRTTVVIQLPVERRPSLPSTDCPGMSGEKG
jgi:nitrogen-specific signal transduction histidine kinase